MPLQPPSHGIQREFIRIQAILAGTNRSTCVHPGRGNTTTPSRHSAARFNAGGTRIIDLFLIFSDKDLSSS
jgi:hypothetical protein